MEYFEINHYETVCDMLLGHVKILMTAWNYKIIQCFRLHAAMNQRLSEVLEFDSKRKNSSYE